jgi:hypothetical protein
MMRLQHRSACIGEQSAIILKSPARHPNTMKNTPARFRAAGGTRGVWGGRDRPIDSKRFSVSHYSNI